VSTVRLVGYEPPARDAGTGVWTIGVVEHTLTPDAEDTWSTVLTVDPLSPVDTDNQNPRARDFTVDDTDEDWWYRVYFRDTGGDATEPSTATSVQLAINYTPTVQQVATKIRTRTRLGTVYDNKPEGFIYGTFSPATNPTSAQVRDVIREAANIVSADLGREVPLRALAAARTVVALRAAMEIELSYYSEQVAAQRSSYPQLKELYDDAMKSTIEAILEAESGGDPEAGSGDPGYPSYGGFPSTAIGMETNW
jgi:hypothetical protein